MRVVVTGATGMIGTKVVKALIDRGDEVLALSRDAASAKPKLDRRAEVASWPDPLTEPPSSDLLAGSDAIIHLLGEPISQRWNDAAKRRIEASRVLSTRHLVNGLRQLPADDRPQTLVSQSATGFYGPLGAEPVDEQHAAGHDYLASVVVGWEAEAHAAAGLTRVVCTRTGVVLANEGGALGKMLPAFRLGVGGPIAGGRQYVPWIHIDDVTAALLFAGDERSLSGPVNVTGPQPVTNARFGKELGRAIHRPAVMPLPGAVLKLMYGEMATIVLTGQNAVPSRLLGSGFEFRYPTVDQALGQLFG